MSDLTLRQAIIAFDDGDKVLIDFWYEGDVLSLVQVAKSQGPSRWGPPSDAEYEPWPDSEWPKTWVASFPDGSQVYVQLWSDGTVEAAKRETPYASWGPSAQNRIA